jgi:adenylate cyclase
MSERRILDSWKAIAAYFGRTVKTCRKWEHELDLPVHRLDDSPKAHVFAYADELDRWKEGKRLPERIRMAPGLTGLGRKARVWLIAAAAVILLVVAGLLVRLTRLGEKSPSPQTVKSVAVLPFVDLGPDRAQEHLGDGIADILINALSRVEGVRTPARTSAFYFKGKDVTPGEIGRKLRVDWILEGSVQVYERKLRVVASLLNASDGYQLWTERYDRNPVDIFAIEDDIALSVIKALQIRLSAADKSQVTRHGTNNPEAYELYLKGQHYRNKGRLFYRQAIESFEKALEKDPNYAQAHAGIASCYYWIGNVGFMRAHEVYPKAKQAALKALEIDGSLAEPKRVLASIKMIFDWDFSGAEHDIRQAIEQNPADAGLHACYTDLLSALGRHDEALVEARLTEEMDPLSIVLNGSVMNAYYYARKYDLALQALKRRLELDPYILGTQLGLIVVNLALGRYEEAKAANERKREIVRSPPARADHDYWSGIIEAWAGNQARARLILANVKDDMKKSYLPSDFCVCIHAALGDIDEAFAWLEKAYEERDCILYLLKVHPLFDPLRSDPRFAGYLRRMGLEK